MRVLIRGAGDLATGIAYRLFKSGYEILMTDIAVPTAVRRTVAFSRCIYEKEAVVEGIRAIRAENVAEAIEIINRGSIAVMVDEKAEAIKAFKPDVLVDAIIAKKNLGTGMDQANLVIGVGPGFTAGQDVHAVVETKRGHYLGRVYYEGSAIPNTGIPGEIGGYSIERIIRASAEGEFQAVKHIGDRVEQGELVARTGGEPVYSLMPGIIRGMLQDGVNVNKGMKCGDIDARCEQDHCFTISDKARSIGGGVLEAIENYRHIKALEAAGRKKIGLVLLAAGEGKRFGSNKLQLEIDGIRLGVLGVNRLEQAKKLLDEELEAALRLDAAGPSFELLSPVVVASDPDVIAAADSFGFPVAFNERPELGISHSIMLGLREINKLSDSAACIFSVCDQPKLDFGTYIRLAKVWSASEKGMIFTGAENEAGDIVSGNPCIFDKKYYPELLKLSGDTGGKTIMKRFPEDAEVMLVDDPEELRDIDLPEDYKQ